MKDNLDEMSIFELDTFVKDVKEYKKERLASEKEVIVDTFKSTVKVGDRVAFQFKDGEEVGDVMKINEKTFTVEFDYDGDTIKRAIQFHRFVGKAETEEVAA